MVYQRINYCKLEMRAKRKMDLRIFFKGIDRKSSIYRQIERCRGGKLNDGGKAELATEKRKQLRTYTV